MKLQLTTDQVQTLVVRCGQSVSVETDVERILDGFASIYHDPFTRPDITAIFTQIKGQQTTRAAAWTRMGSAFRVRSEKVSGKRGYYTQGVKKPSPKPSRQTPPPAPAADLRDDITWVVFELSGAGEHVAREGHLESHLRKILKSPGHEVFVPYLSYKYDGRVALFNAMEGYAFAESGLDERIYLNATAESPYLKGVLSYMGVGTTVLQTVPDSSIRDLRDHLAQMVAVEIQEGMKVEITRGICQGLLGDVVGLTDQDAYILIQLRTLRTIRTIPRFALFPIGEES